MPYSWKIWILCHQIDYEMLLFIVYSRGLVVPRKPCHLQIPVLELHVVVFTLDPAASMCQAVKFGSTRRRFRRLRRWDIFHSVLVSDFEALKRAKMKSWKVGDLPMKYERCLHSWWLKIEIEDPMIQNLNFPIYYTVIWSLRDILCCWFLGS